MLHRFLLALLLPVLVTIARASGEVVYDLGTATLTLDDRGAARLKYADGTAWPAAGPSAFSLRQSGRTLTPRAIRRDGTRLVVTFTDEVAAEFTVAVQPGFAVFRLTRLTGAAAVEQLRLFRLGVPAGATIRTTLNAATAGSNTAAVMAGEPNVHAFSEAATLNVETLARHGVQPAAFGVVACPDDKLWEVMPRFEKAAGLPSPQLGGAWNKRSPWVKRSYLFLTQFSEAQFDEALQLARRGGFDMILLGQESWCEATGHYPIHRRHFPGGLDSLKRTVRRFKDAGFHVGFHFLGPSIYPPDRYLTPVPDPRLVKGAAATLAADVDAKADFLPLTAAPTGFPAADGGYEGDGTVLQVGNELIHYVSLSASPPGFRGCRRGHLGTTVSAHAKGTPVRHLKRSYGYHLFDMDTSLLDEVAGHFAAVADACAIDMIYFDGSERLQGDHWYYNARLHKAFHDKLKNKDVLLQASSFSHYSWHLLARTASADGHGDLKGYLEERSPAFAYYALQGMPMDVGWYYGYDPKATPDQFEYVLGTTIGYGASMSFQVSVEAAKRHPFTGEILDLISRYERLRLADRTPPAMRARLRIDPVLAGAKTAAERDKLLAQRRDYRLLGEAGKEVFQRVVYTPWREMTPDAAGKPETIEVRERARLGFQVHLPGGPWLAPGASYHAADALLLEGFEDLAAFRRDPHGKPVRVIEHGQGGSTLAGVRQRLELGDGGKEGSHFAVYTAESTRERPDGWSVLGRSFTPPLDLSGHAGVGLWLRGDGRGGSFKLQLGDGKGAMDYYLTNDYQGWRYHQLARPKVDAIDYRAVRTLMIYYNGLPGKKTVSCGIDGIKALRRLDRQTLRDPWIEIAGQRLAVPGALTEGQYLLVWPGEPIRRHGPTAAEKAQSEEIARSVEVDAGRHPVRFGHAGAQVGPLRLRVTLQPAERHPLP